MFTHPPQRQPHPVCVDVEMDGWVCGVRSAGGVVTYYQGHHPFFLGSVPVLGVELSLTPTPCTLR
eukprot:NODE_9934_length_250_cov_24.507463_g9193_i0.p2 GENE.NODE_9934_length_250_cov_24.507463_g9193_i0~~NODE_9934_length_250_cov_24.507463_g9193_i0.p2  ORF type:complete len:65 (+),score=22.58 NODE_9934_length_250_cov_24.507463_g9193_i0:54-248(+)